MQKSFGPEMSVFSGTINMNKPVLTRQGGVREKERRGVTKGRVIETRKLFT